VASYLNLGGANFALKTTFRGEFVKSRQNFLNGQVCDVAGGSL
jgi:hypothetical protein